MAQGLQIWDSDGVITLDTTSSTVKILGKFHYSPQIQTLNHPLLLTENHFYFSTPHQRSAFDDELKVTFNGSSYTIDNRNQYVRKTVYIGVY